MTDQLERLFGELRAETMSQILPPGSEAARSTVRRRRTRRTAITAAGLVVLVATGVGFALPARTRKPAPAAAMSREALAALAKSAAKQIGLTDDERDGGSVTAGLGHVTMTRIPGDYEVTVACAGPAGVVHLTVYGVDQPLACTDRPPVIHVPLTVTASDPDVTIDIAPDAVAQGRYGLAFSVKLTDGEKERLIDEAKEGVGAGARAFLDGPEFAEQDGDVRAGQYRFTVACAGAGSVKIELGDLANPSIKTVQLDCDGRTAGYDVTLPPGTTGGGMIATPSADAVHQAALAWRWDPR